MDGIDVHVTASFSFGTGSETIFDNQGTLTIDKNAVLSISAHITGVSTSQNGGIVNNGKLNFGGSGPTVSANVINNGQITVSQSAVFTGNFVNNGVIFLNAARDSYSTDTIIINSTQCTFSGQLNITFVDTWTTTGVILTMFKSPKGVYCSGEFDVHFIGQPSFAPTIIQITPVFVYDVDVGDGMLSHQVYLCATSNATCVDYQRTPPATTSTSAAAATTQTTSTTQQSTTTPTTSAGSGQTTSNPITNSALNITPTCIFFLLAIAFCLL